MLGISGTEFLLVAVVVVLAVGPKDMPHALYTLGRIVRRLQYAQFAMTRQFEEFMRVHDLDELRRSVNFEAAKTAHEPAPDEGAADQAYLAAPAEPSPANDETPSPRERHADSRPE